jgi:DNA polymerase V
MFALIDCNNFYASCEVVFNPKLLHKPLVILSNNDGCVIARSNEAKALKIGMADPIYLHKNLVKQKKLLCLSSNFALYGDMSRRLWHILEGMFNTIEVYSIDEAFVTLTETSTTTLEKIGENIFYTLKQGTGLSTSIGIAPTKTLAKLACEIAKKQKLHQYLLTNRQKIDEILKKTPPSSIWGVGKKVNASLKKLGVYSAYDLMSQDTNFIRKKISVSIVKTILELQGTPCLDKDRTSSSKKSIVCSRSFPSPVTSITSMEEAISSFSATAAKKLRKQNCNASCILVFIRTNLFSDDTYSNSISSLLEHPTNSTPSIINHAKRLLHKIYKHNHNYKKAGVMLTDFSATTSCQQDLFSHAQDIEKNKKLMQTLDSINVKYNKKKVFFAAEGIVKQWQSNPSNRSNRYTTNWDELPIAYT